MGLPFFAEDDDDDDRDEGEAGDEADGVCFFSVAAAEDEGGALAAPLPRSCLGSAREAEVW